MLAFLMSFTVGVSPLLRGAWDLWAQGLIQLLVLSGFTLWLAYHFFLMKNENIGTCRLRRVSQSQLGGQVDTLRRRCVPSLGILTKQNSLLFIVAAASGISVALSPVTSLALSEWRNLLLGLWILLVLPLINQDKKAMAERVLHVAAWILFALAVYQKFVGKNPMPSSSLVNPNSFACFLLMVLPLAVSWRDWPLFGATLLALSWSASWGAWLALAITAILLHKPGSRPSRNIGKPQSLPNGEGSKKPLFRLETVILAAAAIAITLHIATRGYMSIDNRLVWWEAAVGMIADKPFFGFGTGTFAYIFPAYHEPVGGLSSLYAHNWPLQFTAENGIFCSFLWFGMVIFMAHKLKGAKKWAVTAAFIHSFVDFGLYIPSNFWLFCYLLGSRPSLESSGSRSPSPEAEGSLRGAPAEHVKTLPRPGYQYSSVFPILILMAFSSYAARGIWTEWKANKLIVLAQAAYKTGDEKAALEHLVKAENLDGDNAVIPAVLGRIYLDKAGDKGRKSQLLNAAVFFERALELNPFRPGAYAELARVYELAGERELKEAVFKRRDLIFKRGVPPKEE